MAFAPSKSGKHRRKEKGELLLNSMMDMMTIILLFLLKTMGSSGALLRPSPYVSLPEAQREKEPEKGLGILITGMGVFEDVEAKRDAAGNLLPPRQISDTEEMSDPANVVVPSLEDFLREHKDFTLRLGKPFKGEITVQCDKEVTYDWLLKVINTCGQTEYASIDFVVLKAKKS
ncbi:MAG: hypothetical protein FJY67_03540 [Calditrichaeota bacterium]|nr:hypothetical protein [Calditrichota bacterium]